MDPKIIEDIRDRKPVRKIAFAVGNYSEIFAKFSFGTYLWNSVFITVVATLITLLFNAMAAFALSKYRFGGRDAVFLLIISTLMIPPICVVCQLELEAIKAPVPSCSSNVGSANALGTPC